MKYVMFRRDADEVPRLGFKAEIRGQSVLQLAKLTLLITLSISATLIQMNEHTPDLVLCQPATRCR